MSEGLESQVVRRAGYRSALVAFVGGTGYDVAQVSQLIGLLRPPWDGILIYGFSLVIAAPFMVAMVALHQEASLTVLDQTPHSPFWTLDALGYIFLGAATLFAVPVFAGSASRRWVGRFFLTNAPVTPMIALVYFYPRFSIPLLFRVRLGWSQRPDHSYCWG